MFLEFIREEDAVSPEQLISLATGHQSKNNRAQLASVQCNSGISSVLSTQPCETLSGHVIIPWH